MVTLEERTRAELLSADPSVRTAHNKYTHSETLTHIYTLTYRVIGTIKDKGVMSCFLFFFLNVLFSPGAEKFYN